MTVIDAVRGDLAEVRAEVDATLDRFLAEKARTAPDPCLPPLVDVLREFVAGGKRLRPLFCHCGYVAAGGSPDDRAVAWAGAALEMFHTFALVHDDIMDRSELRRGRPTVHRALAERFAGRGAGDGHAAERFGANLAILAGDLCFTWTDEVLDRADVDQRRWRAVRALLHTMRTELIAGQLLDLGGDPRSPADPVRSAWRTIRLKTARYTVELPLRIGVALAGGDAALMRVCGAYGRPVGEAYQLRDDLLGMFGDPGVTGKPHLDDLRGGKPTVLMALAWQQATPGQREVISALHGHPELDEEGATRLRDVVVATGAAARVERLITLRADRALGALRSSSMSPAAKAPLAELVAHATRRAR
ncbi:geranylgeranyl diphosphate synthase type I [Saccharothrix saharensis]|uniref:Geranylgeranyl diphosphate synthase type I n=1 Tax=Saccharothrix saharensis TaxID=571190 RepID=A0A543JME1_9PSEU|nr:polyprenyl synthetase family protein [Saccharothrix saharensis]TQM84027.1 geranylgeranyl diphosphate synthase type I [Saccharothrix saharensis]